MPMEAYIVDCVRTAGGRKKGQLSAWHPADLGSQVVDEVTKRSGVPPAAVDDVIVGCVSQLGSQAANIGRTIVLGSKVLPESVPGTTVDRQCGSSQQALHFAAQAVMSGTQDAVIAAGVEIMTQVPIGSNVSDGMKAGRGNPFGGKAFQSNYQKEDGKLVMPSQFNGAELLAKKYNLSVEELHQFSVESHVRATRATKEGRFKKEILPVEGINSKTKEKIMAVADEGIRPDTSMEGLSKLKPLAGPGGLLTAGAASQICDGASAIMVCNERAVKKYNLKPRAKIITLALAGTDPVIMLEGPIPASQTALRKANMTIDDMDVIEVNEAFASVPVAFLKALKANPAKLNMNGGAIALGHALGSTGTRCMTTLVNNLEQYNGRYGLQAICEGGGTANATIIERIPSGQASKL